MQIQRIKDVAKFYNGYAFKSKNYTDAGDYIVRIGDIKQKGIDLSNAKRVDVIKEKKDLSNFQIKQNSILIAMSGATTGKVSLYNLNQLAYLNQRVGMLVCENNILPKYLYYFLSNYSEKFLTSAIGAAVQNLSKSQIENTKIPVPSLQEQEKIVERLDKVFENIDSSILKTKKNLEYISNVFNSELRNLFSHPEDSDPTLGSLSKITSSKRIYKSDYVEEGIPFYRTKEIKELANNQKITKKLFIDNKKYNELLKNFGAPSKGDVLVTAIGTIGEIYVVDSKDKFYFKDGNIIWIKELKGIEPHYLKYSLMSFVNKLKKLSHGAAYNALSIEKLKSFKFKAPSVDEQSQIVSKLNNLKNILNKLVDLNLNKINQLNLLKKSMLNTVFSSESIKEVA